MHEKRPRQDPQLLRRVAEAQSLGASVMESDVRPADELLHELRVYKIELEMQNETLRQTQMALEESRDRYVDLYDFAPTGYLTLTDKAFIAEINLTSAALLGEQRNKLLRRRFAHFVSAEDSDRWHQDFLRVARHGEKLRSEIVIQRDDGSRFPAQLIFLRLEKPGAKPVVRISLTDITERKRAEDELRIAAAAFELHEGMMVTDANGVILRVNQAFTRLTGYTAEEAAGKTPELLRSERHDELFYQHMWQALLLNKHWQGVIWSRHKDGKIYAEWLSMSAVRAQDGRTINYVGVFSDITQNSEAEAEIHRLAYYDPLTQLPNRRLLQDRLAQALAATVRNGRCGAILFLDLDNFKMLNDMYGHDAGDLLLVELSQRLLACVRAGDTVARLGGDEFVLLLEELSADPEEAAVQAKQVGDKVQESVAQPFHFKGHEYQCTNSMGIRLYRDNDTSAEELLRHADLALYESKSAGRNTLRFFDPVMQLMQDRRNALVNDLRRACQRGQLRLYYQPQIETEGARGIVGAEALLRWMHPDRGLVEPGEFIHLAEETGLIQAIGHWVLATACAQIKAWEGNASTRELKLSINVSARQFRQPNFVAEVRQALKQTGADPTHLKFELTESLVLNDIADTLRKMLALDSLGIGCSLDDFGTGFSSLSYLARLPLGEIKIDKTFVTNLPGSRNDSIITQTVITMARNLGLKVVAEGVETEEQREFLDRHGCHSYQGYLFSRPLPLKEFEQLLVQSRSQAMESVGVD